MTNYYDVLGVTENSTDEEIKKSYRRLAMQYHPDRNSDPHAEIKFKEIKEAYEELSDPIRKSKYDLSRNNEWKFSSPFDNWASANENFDNPSIDDLYENWRRQQSRKDTTKSHKASQRITLEQSYTGTTIIVNGESLRIPPGIRNGSRLFVKNTIVEIIVLPHSKFKRTNDDLLIDININVFESMVGIQMTVTHLDGKKLQFDIPAGLQPNQVVRLSGLGMMNPETNNNGDLLIRCNVSIPKVVTSEQKELLEKLFPIRKSIDI